MEMQSEASTASKQQKKFQKSRNSPETVRRPLFIPGTTKPARTVFAGKRARFPSKAVIEYPKLKLRRPSPCPSPPKPDITAKVVRGQDTLLISFCKNPEKCVVDPNDIDCGSSPFQRLQVITTTTDPDLDEQIQAEAAKSQIHTQPLSCFKPPKWVLLEDQQKPEIGPTEPSGGGGHVETKQPASEKRTHSADKEKSPAQKRKVQDDIGWEKLKSIEQDAKDAKGENIKTGNAEGKEPSGDSKAKARGGQGGDGLQESRKLQPDFERISHDIVLEAQINEHFQSDAPFANRGPFRKPMKEDDGKANELIQKYLSVQESQGEASGGEWPYINTSVHQEDLATYRVLSDQLQDAQRLMDMPVRKREKRLWKATGSK